MSTDGTSHVGGVKSCEATGGSVVIILSGTTASFNVFVRRAMNKIVYASTAGKLTGVLNNYGKDV